MNPDFLVIGAKKAGTTWLYQNLKAHPDIWLAPEKELHYFDLPKHLPFFAFVCAPKRGPRHFVINRLKRALHKAQAHPEHRAWYARYYLLPRTDTWYQALFATAAGRVSGDITPDYAVLADKHIAHVHKLMPQTKLIYLLRDPIEKMWSQAAMYFSERVGYQGIHTIDPQRLAQFLSDPQRLAHATYFANLQRWGNHYSDDQLFVGFFDDLALNPRQLLRDIFVFLDVDPSDEHISELCTQKIFARQYPDMPANMAHLLATHLIDDLSKLNQRFANVHTQKWLDAAETFLETA